MIKIVAISSNFLQSSRLYFFFQTSRHWLAIFSFMLLCSCSSSGTISEKQRKIQFEADAAVADILFERDLSLLASYNVHKNGDVVILFDESLNFATYNGVVQALRKNNSIRSVRAEQSGIEVCPIDI